MNVNVKKKLRSRFLETLEFYYCPVHNLYLLLGFLADFGHSKTIWKLILWRKSPSILISLYSLFFFNEYFLKVGEFFEKFTRCAFIKKFIKKKIRVVKIWVYSEIFFIKLPFKWFLNEQNRPRNTRGDPKWRWKLEVQRYDIFEFFIPIRNT